MTATCSPRQTPRYGTRCSRAQRAATICIAIALCSIRIIMIFCSKHINSSHNAPCLRRRDRRSRQALQRRALLKCVDQRKLCYERIQIFFLWKKWSKRCLPDRNWRQAKHTHTHTHTHTQIHTNTHTYTQIHVYAWRRTVNRNVKCANKRNANNSPLVTASSLPSGCSSRVESINMIWKQTKRIIYNKKSIVGIITNEINKYFTKCHCNDNEHLGARRLRQSRACANHNDVIFQQKKKTSLIVDS